MAMTGNNGWIERVDDRVEGVENFVVKILLTFQVLIIFSEIIFRYVLNSSLIWSEELARYLLVWIAMFGCAIGLKKKGHFGIDLLVRTFPPGLRKLCLLLTYTIMFIFLGTMTVVGVLMVAQAGEVSTVMRISMSYPYAAIPLGGLLMIFHLIVIVKQEGLRTFS
jgi:TRAP-type C4-dicarboxylate transport system permease small subunit